VRVIYHSEPDGWWAEAPDFPGYTAVGATFEEVRELVFEGISDLAEKELEELYLEEIAPSITAGGFLTGTLLGISLEETVWFRGPQSDLSNTTRTGKHRELQHQ
jgi:predicted RNase H-like HicB family nuclease